MGDTARRRTDQVRLGAELSALLSGAGEGDLSEVVTAALGHIARRVDVDVAFAALVSHDLVDEVWEWSPPSVPAQAPRRGEPVALAFGTALEFLRAGQPCPITDLTAIHVAPTHRARFDATGARALLLVPVRSRDQLVGVTGFLVVDHPRSWEPGDTEALRTFSKVLVTAVLRRRSGAGSAAAAIRASRIAECIPDGLLTATPDGVITWASPAMGRILGVDPHGLVGQATATLAPGFADEVQDLVDRVLGGHAPESVSAPVPGPDGSDRWCELQVALAGDGPGDTTAELLFTMRDVHSRHQEVAQLEHAASHDSLTGAANRWGLHTQYQERLSHAHPVFLALIDVDDFKAVNDRHGHPAGDRVLVELVARMRGLAGAHGLVARLGGDEFVVVSDDVRHATDAGRRCDRLVADLRVAAGPGDHATVSVGAVLSAAPAELGGLVAQADDAIYRAKAAGRDRWCLHQLAIT